jgi:hypothetical protein
VEFEEDLGMYVVVGCSGLSPGRVIVLHLDLVNLNSLYLGFLTAEIKATLRGKIEQR